MRRLCAAVLVVAALGSSCSVLLDLEDAQCKSDADCARFGAGVSCDLYDKTCVRGSFAPPEDAAAPGVDAPVGGDTAPVAGDAAPVAPDGALEPRDGPPPPDGPGLSVDTGPMPADAEPVDSAPEDPCAAPDKKVARIEGEITSSFTLTCDKDYLLVGKVLVKSDVVLTIAAGTTLLGDRVSKGALVVQPGGRLVAVGTAERPIVFTSMAPREQRRPGDWGGVILLGRAPVNSAMPTIEGLVEGGEYGGTDENDSSGSLQYVRIEYSGIEIAPNNEINGLTLGGVGRGTLIDHVQVRHTADDCFEFFGGTVNAKHLVCQWNGDDGFDWDNGYRGKLQFLVLQQDPRVADETNGIEADNDALGSMREPRSAPTVFNATLCGKNMDVPREQYGLLLRRATRGMVANVLVGGFEAGLDIRDATTAAEVQSALFFGNLAAPISYVEDGSDTNVHKDDDAGFDELKWFVDPTRKNATSPTSPIPDCFDANRLRLLPATPLTANATKPPADGFFDANATFIGAFRDENDDWTKGGWVVWSDK